MAQPVVGERLLCMRAFVDVIAVVEWHIEEDLFTIPVSASASLFATWLLHPQQHTPPRKRGSPVSTASFLQVRHAHTSAVFFS